MHGCMYSLLLWYLFIIKKWKEVKKKCEFFQLDWFLYYIINNIKFIFYYYALVYLLYIYNNIIIKFIYIDQ